MKMNKIEQEVVVESALECRSYWQNPLARIGKFLLTLSCVRQRLFHISFRLNRELEYHIVYSPCTLHFTGHKLTHDTSDNITGHQKVQARRNSPFLLASQTHQVLYVQHALIAGPNALT